MTEGPNRCSSDPSQKTPLCLQYSAATGGSRPKAAGLLGQEKDRPFGEEETAVEEGTEKQEKIIKH